MTPEEYKYWPRCVRCKLMLFAEWGDDMERKVCSVCTTHDLAKQERDLAKQERCLAEQERYLAALAEQERMRRHATPPQSNESWTPPQERTSQRERHPPPLSQDDRGGLAGMVLAGAWVLGAFVYGFEQEGLATIIFLGGIVVGAIIFFSGD